MYFDFIVGNPPFQNPNSMASSGKLWGKFIKKSLSIGDTLCLITPNSWIKGNIAPQGNGKFLNILANKPRHISFLNNMDCNSFFKKIAVNFSFFISIKSNTNNTNNTNNTKNTIIQQNNKTFNVNLNNIFTLPKNIEHISITNKFYGIYDKIPHQLITNSRNQYIKNNKNGKYKVFSNGKIFQTNSELYENNNKILIPWANHYQYSKVGNFIAGDQSIVFSDFSPVHLQNLYNVLMSELYQFCNQAVKMSMHNEGARHFPYINLNTNWNNHMIYDFFQLSKKEINIVKNNI